MSTFSCVVTSTPERDVAMLTSVVAGGDTTRFLDIVIDFALPIARALSTGAKVAAGGECFGYHEIDITLSGPMNPFHNIRTSFQLECAVTDVPTRSRLRLLATLLRVQNEGEAMNRVLYWFWVAAQLASIERPIFIMDHRKGIWAPYRYQLLWDARREFGY